MINLLDLLSNKKREDRWNYFYSEVDKIHKNLILDKFENDYKFDPEAEKILRDNLSDLYIKDENTNTANNPTGRKRTCKWRIPWGSWDLEGNWYPNKDLKMTEHEQRLRNINNFYSKSD